MSFCYTLNTTKVNSGSENYGLNFAMMIVQNQVAETVTHMLEEIYSHRKKNLHIVLRNQKFSIKILRNINILSAQHSLIHYSSSQIQEVALHKPTGMHYDSIMIKHKIRPSHIICVRQWNTTRVPIYSEELLWLIRTAWDWDLDRYRESDWYNRR